MPYDELGNFIYDDAPSVDEMRFELAKKLGQITQPAEQVIRHLPGAGLAEAAATIGSGMLAMPPAAAYAIARGIASGEYGKSTKQAENYFGQAMDAMTYRPRTQAGRETLETIEELPRKITGSHMGFGPLPELMVPIARGVSPNDVRVMGANVRRIGNEIVELPQDFRAAQEGLRRQNVFGEPTLGVKAEAVASDIGDVLARRQAAGKSTIPGIPDIVPETNLYAVRNTGEGQLIIPTERPGVNSRDLTNYGQMARVNEAALGFNPQTFREQPIEQFNRYMDQFINPEGVPQSIRKGWSAYFQERVQGLFPGADKQEAMEGWSQLVSPTDQTRYKNEFLQDFVAKQENKEVARAAGLDLPDLDEYKKRVEAAEKWLKGPFTKYVQKFVGTKDDPLLQLAEKGLVPTESSRLLEDFEGLTSNRLRALKQHREQAGFNPEGEYSEKLTATEWSLENAKVAERELSTKQNAIARRLAETNPGEDPARISPEFAALSNQVTAKVSQIDKLEKQLENLKLAKAYETLSDYSILPHTAGEVKRDLTFVESQLFPGLAKTPDEAKMIELSRTGTQGSGIENAAKEYVNDIITGKLPIDQISNVSFEKHVGRQAQFRAQEEQAAKLAAKKKIDDLNNYARARVASQPEYLRFGNANVVEFNKLTPLDEIRKGLSFETEMLDHCLGSGGSGAGRKHFITGEDRSHTPIIDPITGEVPKGSSGNDRGYVDHVRKGTTEIASVRDVNTGYPAVTIEFNKTGKDKFNLGYVSGYKNRVPEPEYRNATRDYLNSRADEIAGIGSNLERYGIYDQKNLDVVKLGRITNANPKQISTEQLAELPRFLTQNDLIKAVDGEVVDLPPLPSRPAREMLPATTPEQQGAGAVGAFREYRTWLNDRYPTPQERLTQVTEDLSDIANGRVAPGQYGLDEAQFEQFYGQLEQLQTELAAQRNQANTLPAPRDIADRAITTQSQFRDREVQALTEAINNEIRALPTERQSLERYINTVNNNLLDLPGPIEQHLFNDESRNAISDYLIQQAQNRIDNLPAARAEPQAIDRLIREEQHNIDRAWDMLTQNYEYDGMTPTEIREQARSLRRDPEVVLGQATEEFLLHPGFIEGLARQIEEQANQQAQLLREMGEMDLNEVLNDSLQTIRGQHGEGAFNDVIEIANNISRDIDLTDDPERYISALRFQSDDHAGSVRSAMLHLADDLEGAHMRDWEPAEDPGLALPAPRLPPHERPLQFGAPRGDDPAAYRDYYTAEASGAPRAFDEIIQAERMTPGAIEEAIRRTDGQAMYDPDVMRFYNVESPAGVSQINHALRRYVEGRERTTLGPTAEEDQLPPVRQIPMGRNFLSDAVDAMLDNNHIDTLMELYREIADEVDDLSDRTNQTRILRLLRNFADDLNEQGDGDAALAAHYTADLMRDSIREASQNPEGHKKGGYISKKPVYFAENPDAMRYELLRNK